MGANAELLKLIGPELGLLLPELDEKARRLTLGAVARAAGDGGITAVAKLTGASWQTVADGAGELTGQGHRCSPQTAWRLLHEQGFSTQANAKVTEGRRHPDRDAQFRYIAAQAKEHLAAGQLVISVDAKKKEQAGEFAQAGRGWGPKGDPVRARDHSFPDEQAGHAIPYGACD